MAELNNALQTAMTFVPECLATGYIDLSSGMLLGVVSVDSQPVEVVELLAAATADLFCGVNVQIIENIFRKTRGLKEGSGHYFQEIIVNSTSLMHIFIRATNQDQVACFVCKRSVNPGMALTKARMSLAALESAVKAAFPAVASL